PRFEGSKDVLFAVTPLVSLGRVGPEARFTSRNDNVSLAFVDKGAFRAGITGKFVWGRDSDKDGLKGVDDVKLGAEAGGFAEIYPTDWLRVRSEVRHGIRSHNGVVADLAVDAFADLSDTVRLSGGPRVSWASSDFFDAYYGVSNAEAKASGLSPYAPGSGWRSAGVGGAVTWKTTERLNTSVFAEYARLLGPAADSSIVGERGSADQFTAGVTASYRFDVLSVP
ncbi:MAG: MipA/OmpV family protein, partial [Methylobacterium mesophilicum]|nr:MipA/OmpV family protein [Methylobacterium mesophilicum]